MILAAITSVLLSTTPSFPCGAEVQLKSWKGDYLSRPDTTTPGVTSSASGAGTRWITECANGKVKLKSWKGDYLHRPDSAQGVTTSATGIGNEWTTEFAADKLMLKSWKGDYLHRPNTVQGLTSEGNGATSIGNLWTLEPVTAAAPTASAAIEGYEIITSDASFTNVAPFARTLNCPAGKKALSGGWYNTTTSLLGQPQNPATLPQDFLKVYTSYILPNGGGWYVYASFVSSAQSQVRFYVVCATAK